MDDGFVAVLKKSVQSNLLEGIYHMNATAEYALRLHVSRGR